MKRPVIKTSSSAFLLDKGNHPPLHGEGNPRAAGSRRAYAVALHRHGEGKRVLPGKLPFDLKNIERVSISACGTAYYAGLVAKYWFERFARLPVEIDVASEFRYREAPMRKGDLGAVRVRNPVRPPTRWRRSATPKSRGCMFSSVVNVQTSTIARESDVIMPTLAGPEIGVASTKAFTCQLSVLACASPSPRACARIRSAWRTKRKLVRALIEVPRYMNETLALEGAHRGVWRAISARAAMCSISAAAPAIRWRWKAR